LLERLHSPKARSLAQRHRLLHILFFLQFFTFFPAATAHADSSDTLTLSGMNFECEDCALVSEDPCQVRLESEPRLLACNDAVHQLLSKLVESSGAPDMPTVAELRKYLLSENVSPDIAGSALALMLRSDIGRRALIQDAYSFATKYSAPLAKLVSSERSTSDVWLAFWRLPGQEGIQLDGALRAAIIAQRKELSAQDLFGDLTIVDPEKDMSELKIYEDALQKDRKDLADLVRSAREYLDTCGDFASIDRNPERCSNEHLQKLPPAESKYLQRVQIHNLILDSRSQNVTPAQLLSRLRQVNYEEFRTPEAHELMKRVLEESRNLSFADREKLLSEENVKVFSTFAENDAVIAHDFVVLLCKQADESWDKDDRVKTTELLQLSFKIIPGASDDRRKLLDKITQSDAWKSDTDLQEHFAEFMPAADGGGGQVSGGGLDQNKLLGILAIVSGLSFIWMLFVYHARQQRTKLDESAIQDEIILASEEAELQDLREYFELGPEDEESELTKSYRKKAKETHPDVQKGADGDFQDLQAKYQRARELLLRARQAASADTVIEAGDSSSAAAERDE
jgi:hypothetical protein